MKAEPCRCGADDCPWCRPMTHRECLDKFRSLYDDDPIWDDRSEDYVDEEAEDEAE